MPKISVIMSVYKEPLEWIKESINSILDQTFRDFEFIIVDDNPEDDRLLETLKEYEKKDGRICIIINKSNIGLTKSLNLALKRVQGEFIARMDADDISCQNRFQIQYSYMVSHPEVDVCGAFYKTVGDVSFLSSKIGKMPIYDTDIKDLMLFNNPMVHPVSFYKTSIKGEKVFYDDKISKAQDYQLWFELALRGAVFANIDRVLIKYRKSCDQISRKNSGAQIVTGNRIRMALLMKRMPFLSKEQITIHNEICTFQFSTYDLGTKLKYLSFLHTQLVDNALLKSDYLSEVIALYFFHTCLLYKRPFYFFTFSFWRKKIVLKSWFIRGLMKYCISQLHN